MLGQNPFPCLFQIPGMPTFLGHGPPPSSNQQRGIPPTWLLSLPLSLWLSSLTSFSTFKDHGDYIGPTQLIQNNFPILRLADQQHCLPLCMYSTLFTESGIRTWTSLGTALLPNNQDLGAKCSDSKSNDFSTIVLFSNWRFA